MRLTCGGLGRTPQGGDLAPGGPLGAPSPCCPAGEGRVPLGLAHSSSPSSFCLSSMPPSQSFILSSSTQLPSSAFPVLLSPPRSHSSWLVLFSCFALLALCSGSFSLVKISHCHSVSQPPCLAASHYSRGPDSSSGPLLSFSSASTPWSPARRNPPPFGELSAQAPPLSLPLPCSPLIEMLMRLLLLPSLAGRRAPWPASAPVR